MTADEFSFHNKNSQEETSRISRRLWNSILGKRFFSESVPWIALIILAKYMSLAIDLQRQQRRCVAK